MEVVPKSGTVKDVIRSGYSMEVANILGCIDELFEQLVALDAINGDDVEILGNATAGAMLKHRDRAN
jgi:hypothetical protein